MQQLTVLVSPLDWGLGHASRLIPVVSRLTSDNHRVVLAGSGRSLQLLQNAFPGLPAILLPSAGIRLGGWIPVPLQLFFQIPKMIWSVFREHQKIKHIIDLFGIQMIISDNRYGLYCRSCYSVLVTHQISPILPPGFHWLEYPLYRLMSRLILAFEECWIPDVEDPVVNLSGDLSHRYPLPSNTRFIGLLSRFDLPGIRQPDTRQVPADLVVVLSGPEPQISRFEKRILHGLSYHRGTALLIRGVREGGICLSGGTDQQIRRVAHLQDPEFAYMLQNAKYVICRSGYSGIMDLLALGIRAILVPTPGQSEQTYLARRLFATGRFSMQKQRSLDLSNLPAQVKSSQAGSENQLVNTPGLFDPYVFLHVKHNQHNQQPQ